MPSFDAFIFLASVTKGMLMKRSQIHEKNMSNVMIRHFLLKILFQAQNFSTFLKT